MPRFFINCTLSLALVLQASNIWGQQPAARQPTAANPQPAGQPAAPAAQQIRVPLMTAAAAIEAGLAQTAPQAPFPPLDAREQQYLDQVLNVWEERTAQVDQFQCDFKRWQFEHGPDPISIASGIIKFAKPDKGLFRVDDLRSITGDPKNPYQANPRAPFGDYWICDGAWVHNLDRNEKKAVRTQLPPEMQGNQIHLSPLPFLFGVKAAEIKQRYFVHTVTPPAGNNDVWVEAWPKRADDAGNYSRVQIVLDRTDVLPKTMIVFMPNWTPEKKHREVYEFENRDLMGGLFNKVKQSLFMQDFISTKLSSEWQVIEEPWVPQQEESQTAPQGQGNPALAPNGPAAGGAPSPAQQPRTATLGGATLK